MSREMFEANLNEALRLAEKLGEAIIKVFPTAPRSPEEQADFEKRMVAAREKILSST